MSLKEIFDDQENDINLEPYVQSIKKHLKWILLTALVVGLAMGIVRKFTYKPEYLSTTTWLGEQSSSNAQLSTLASLAGVNLANSSIPVDLLYTNYLKSPDLVKDLRQSQFHQFLKSPTQFQPFAQIVLEKPTKSNVAWISDSLEIDNKLLAWTKSHIKYTFEKGTHTLSITTLDPVFSQELNQKILALLKNFNEFKRKSSSSFQRDYIKKQLDSNALALTQIEDQYKSYQEKNMLGSSPEILLAQKRMMQEIEIRTNLVLELRKQYEFAKIEANKGIQPIEPILEPSIADKPLGSKAAIWAIGGSLASALFYGLLLCLFTFQRQKKILIKDTIHA